MRPGCNLCSQLAHSTAEEGFSRVQKLHVHVEGASGGGLAAPLRTCLEGGSSTTSTSSSPSDSTIAGEHDRLRPEPPLAEDEASTWTTTAARLRGASTSRGDAAEPPTTFVTFLWPKCDDMSTFAVALALTAGQRVEAAARFRSRLPGRSVNFSDRKFLMDSGDPYVCYTSHPYVFMLERATCSKHPQKWIVPFTACSLLPCASS